jgi:hypothetical protein
MNFPNKLMDRNNLSKKILVGDLWFVNEFVGNNLIDGFTDGESMPNCFYSLHYVNIFIDEYNISPTEKPYVNGEFFCPSVFSSMNLTYNCQLFC